MRKHDQGSAAAEGARRATGAAAERDRKGRFQPGASARWCCVCCAERITVQDLSARGVGRRASCASKARRFSPRESERSGP